MTEEERLAKADQIRGHLARLRGIIHLKEAGLPCDEEREQCYREMEAALDDAWLERTTKADRECRPTP